MEGVVDTSAASAAEMATGDYLAAMGVMLQGANGDSVFSNDKALFGYVKESEYLIIPHSFHVAATTKVRVGGDEKDFPKITLAEFGGTNHVKGKLGAGGNAYRDSTLYLYYNNNLLLTKIALLNFAKLVAGGVTERAAFSVASLRARWCMLGAYNVRVEDANLTFNEVTIYGDPAAAGNDFGADTYASEYDQMANAADMAALLSVNLDVSRLFMKYLKASDIGAKWVTGVAECLWASEEYIVRVRGHHYKDLYLANLKKFVEACFEGEDMLPKDIPADILFRTSIHAFGLRALVVMAGHWAVWGKLANAALIRFSAAPNGMAVVTTTVAAIRTMASEPWYGQFLKTYKTQMDLLEAFEAKVLANKFGFHMSARIYDVNPVNSVVVDGKTYTVEQMKAVGATMASIGQGFIEAMRSAVKSGAITTFSFANAKAMEKHAGNAPLTTLRIKTLIMYAIDSVSQAGSVNDAIAAAIPQTKKEIKEAGEVEVVE